MTGQAALSALTRAGFRVRLDGKAGGLLVSPADRLTEYDRQDIRANKPALLAWLWIADDLEAVSPFGRDGLLPPGCSGCEDCQWGAT